MKELITNLLSNLPLEMRNIKKPLYLDLVLDGGAFNGSYLIGALKFLKKMEENGWIKIRRISGASIGAICGFLYLTDALDEFKYFYTELSSHFRTHKNLNKTEQFTNRLRDIWEKSQQIKNKNDNDNDNEEGKLIFKKRLYISYWDISKCQKITINSYKNINSLLKIINRSCFVPLFLNGKMLCDDKYMDGLSPYIFSHKTKPNPKLKPKKEKEIKKETIKEKEMEMEKEMKKEKETIKAANYKILFLNLVGINKVNEIWNIRNEITNEQRVLFGMLDIHNFFIKETATSMCSYVDEFGTYNFISNNFVYNNKLRYVIEYMFVFMMKIYYIMLSFFEYYELNHKIDKYICHPNNYKLRIIIYYFKSLLMGLQNLFIELNCL